MKLERLRPLVEIMAAERTKDHPELFEDCVQEGLIAAWQASLLHPDRPDSYYAAAARNGVTNPVRGRASFGAASHRGKQDAWAFTGPLVIEHDGEEVLVVEPDDPAAQAAYDAVSYGPIHSAVADLASEDRAVVLGRYWAEKSFKELSGTLGRSHDALQHRWKSHIRPALAQKLEDWAA